MLDVGQKMARRYHVEIDGKVVIDFANFWLPPTTSWFGDLSSGRHSIRVIGAQDDQPVLFWRAADDRTVLRSPVADAVDYVVFAGPTPDEVISALSAGNRASTVDAVVGVWLYSLPGAVPFKSGDSGHGGGVQKAPIAARSHSAGLAVLGQVRLECNEMGRTVLSGS